MAPIDFEIWLNHFEHHARHPSGVPRGLRSRLTPDDRRTIASSMATFQLGEQSGGHTLLKAAQGFAHARDNPALPRIFELLIREEQRHAAQLLAYMSENHIAPKRTDWTDQWFRRLRRLAGLELYLHVLISAELIGIVYYRALATATACPRLTMLCRVLVSDELAHVGFESQLLLSMRAGRAAPVRTLMRLSHRAFFTGTAGVVWLTHRALLRRAGSGANRFLHDCFSQYAFYLEPIEAGLIGRRIAQRPAVSDAARVPVATAAQAHARPRRW
jgi:hypothetical protein